MDEPHVSVVMAVHNAVAFLDQALDSALGQRGVRHEVIVVDDGSTDRTPELLTRADPRLRVIRQANRGRSEARNRGIAAASGRYVAFLDGDDWWEPSFLAEMCAALERAGDEYGLAYCGWQNVGLPGGRGEPFIPPEYECPNKIALLLENCRWPLHGALVRRELLLRAGGFPSDMAFSEDFALWLEIAPFTRMVRVPKVLAYYRHHKGAEQAPSAAHLALCHLAAQRRFLARHPGVRRMLGGRVVRRLTLGELRRRALAAYWQRDLRSARILFRRLLRGGYAGLADLRLMLPALLPARWHEALVLARDRRQTAVG